MRDNGGFTLIELIFTIILVAIGIVGLVSAMSFMTSRSINAESTTTSTSLAREGMEQLYAEKRANGYLAAPLNIGTTVTLLAGTYADYTRTVEICYVDANIQNPDCDPLVLPNDDLGYKRVTVTVVNTRAPIESTAPLVSLLTDY